MLLIVYFLIFLIVFKIFYKLTTQWCKSPTCLIGKTVIVTGGDSGIGYQTALDFAKRGARVIITSLELKVGLVAQKNIIAQSNNENIIVKHIDLTSFKSVRSFAKDINETEEKIDVLVNNAGCPINVKVTEDGFGNVIQVNYLSMFLLTHLLLDKLKKAKTARIINVSSFLAFFATINLSQLKTAHYVTSKLCVILFTRELAKKLKNSNVTTFSLHPGAVCTPIYNISKILTLISYFFMTATEGAQTSIHLAVEKDIEHLSGEHFHDCYKVYRYWNTYNEDVAKELWKETEKIVQLKTE